MKSPSWSSIEPTPSTSRKQEPSRTRQNAGSACAAYFTAHRPAPLITLERTVCGRNREITAASGSEEVPLGCSVSWRDEARIVRGSHDSARRSASRSEEHTSELQSQS